MEQVEAEKSKMVARRTTETTILYVRPNWTSALHCYVCGELFRRPRVLPCGHTFCFSCILEVRDEALAAVNPRKMLPQIGTATVDLKCPFPSCPHTVKLMNLSRWTSKNRAIADAVATAKKSRKSLRDVGTQTMAPAPKRNRLSSNVTSQTEKKSYLERIMETVINMNTLTRSSLLPNTRVWDSCLLIIGAKILENL